MAKPQMFKGWSSEFPLTDEPADPFGRPGVIDRWHDGDTFFHWTWLREGVVVYDACRIADLYAPELHEPGGVTKRDEARVLYPAGSPIKVVQLYESFERWVSVVTDEAGRNVNARFVEKGIGQRERPRNRGVAESTHPETGVPLRSRDVAKRVYSSGIGPRSPLATKPYYRRKDQN